MDTAGELLEAAKRSHKAGDLQQAEQLYRQIINTAPGFPGLWHVWYLLGAACQELGKYSEAESHLRQAVRLRPDSAEAHCHLGVALAQQAKHVAAEESFRSALRLKPDLDDALV